jgi:hypothetical protein
MTTPSEPLADGPRPDPAEAADQPVLAHAGPATVPAASPPDQGARPAQAGPATLAPSSSSGQETLPGQPNQTSRDDLPGAAASTGWASPTPPSGQAAWPGPGPAPDGTLAAPGYPAGAPGYSASVPGYPGGVPGYPASVPGYPGGVPGYPAGVPGMGGPPKRPGHARRVVTLVALIVVGIAGVAGGGFALAHELTRGPTQAEIAAAGAKEMASRWQRLPAGKIFPATISYTNSENDSAVAHLVGIAAPTSCRSALSAAAFTALHPFGCTTMLRATYVDTSGTLAATVGVAVMASPTAANNASVRLGPLTSGITMNALSFPGTITNAFTNAQLASGGSQTFGNGPYLFLYSSGYTDGMPASAARANPELNPLGTGVLTSLESTLTSLGNPCSMKDIHC